MVRRWLGFSIAPLVSFMGGNHTGFGVAVVVARLVGGGNTHAVSTSETRTVRREQYLLFHLKLCYSSFGPLYIASMIESTGPRYGK